LAGFSDHPSFRRNSPAWMIGTLLRRSFLPAAFPMNHRDTTIAIKRPSLLILGLLLIATTLRAPVTGVAPILDSLQSMFGLSPAEAGLLTTLPLLAFGVISPFAALFAREYGLERALFVALLLTVVGVAVRSLGLAWCLYAGTCCIGAGIAVGNVLLPSLAKRDFPARVPVIMGACALAMGGAAALASASAVPLSHAWPHSYGRLSSVLAPHPRAIRPRRRMAGACGIRRWPGRSRCSWASIRCCITSWSVGCHRSLSMRDSPLPRQDRCMA
jgi:MFS family permease